MNVAASQFASSIMNSTLQTARPSQEPSVQGEDRRPPPPPKGGRGGELDTGALLEQLAADFGDEAVEAVTNEDGGLDFDALKSFLDEHLAGAARPQGPPPESGLGNEDTFAMLTEQFGEEAVASLKNKDGSIDTEALRTFVQEKIEAGELEPPAPPPPRGAGNAEQVAMSQYQASASGGSGYSILSILV